MLRAVICHYQKTFLSCIHTEAVQKSRRGGCHRSIVDVLCVIVRTEVLIANVARVGNAVGLPHRREFQVQALLNSIIFLRY